MFGGTSYGAKSVSACPYLRSFLEIQIDFLPCILVGRCVCVYVCRQRLVGYHSFIRNARSSESPSLFSSFSLDHYFLTIQPKDSGLDPGKECCFYWDTDNSSSQFLSVS